MGPKLLEWLSQYVLQSNLSVSGFVKGVKVALLHFFSTNAASALCQPVAAAAHPSAPPTGIPAHRHPGLWRAARAVVDSLPDEVRPL